jgi:hypothetical protein
VVGNLTPYEQRVREEIAAWQEEKVEAFSRAMNVVGRPVEQAYKHVPEEYGRRDPGPLLPQLPYDPADRDAGLLFDMSRVVLFICRLQTTSWAQECEPRSGCGSEGYSSGS